MVNADRLQQRHSFWLICVSVPGKLIVTTYILKEQIDSLYCFAASNCDSTVLDNSVCTHHANILYNTLGKMGNTLGLFAEKQDSA